MSGKKKTAVKTGARKVSPKAEASSAKGDPGSIPGGSTPTSMPGNGQMGPDKRELARRLALVIGDRIRGARLKRGMSQRQLADRLNAHQRDIFRYESGQVMPGLPNLLLAARVLQVRLEYLVPDDLRETYEVLTEGAADESGADS